MGAMRSAFPLVLMKSLTLRSVQKIQRAVIKNYLKSTKVNCAAKPPSKLSIHIIRTLTGLDRMDD